MGKVSRLIKSLNGLSRGQAAAGNNPLQNTFLQPAAVFRGWCRAGPAKIKVSFFNLGQYIPFGRFQCYVLSRPSHGRRIEFDQKCI